MASMYEKWFTRKYTPDRFPLLCLVKEKHETYHYLCRDLEDVQGIALAVVARRLEEEWYDCDVSLAQMAKIKRLVETRNGWGALDLLLQRAEYEYEGIEFTEFDQWGGS